MSPPSRREFVAAGGLAQSAEYRDAVLPPGVRARVSVEAGSPFGWERYVGSVGAIIGVDHFGASAPGSVVMARYGFTAEHVIATAKAVLARSLRRDAEEEIE